MIAQTSSGRRAEPVADSVIDCATSRTFRWVWLEMCASRSKATWSLQLVSSMRMPLACSITARLAIAARNCSTSASSACTRPASGAGAALSVTSMQTPSTALTPPVGSSSGSPKRTTVRSSPSARTIRLCTVNGVPAVQATVSASSVRVRSSGCWWCRSTSVDGSAVPGRRPCSANISGDHHQELVRRS